MSFPQAKDVTVTQISDYVYFVTISTNGIGAILGTCATTGRSFGISNITLEQVKEIYFSENAQEIAHLPYNEEEVKFIKTGITEEGFNKALSSLLN